MRHHLLVVSEKKIKMLSFIAGAKIFFCVQPTYIHNKYMYRIRAYIFNIVGVMLRTDDARCRTPTMDAGLSTPYYKLTGELKTRFAAAES